MSAVNATTRLVGSSSTEKGHFRTKKISAPVHLYQKMYSKSSSTPNQKKSIDSEVVKVPPAEVELFEDKYFMNMMRPKEICGDPQFCVDGYDRFDVEQGDLGNCWFLAVLANLTANKNLFSQVVSEPCSFDSEEYVGKFHFRFWDFGEWMEVVIDDRLPTVNGELIYLRSSKQNEFWSPLFEKAYSKFRGTTYQAIDSGYSCDAMQDLTGGLTEFYSINSVHNDFFIILLKAHERNALITCGTEENTVKEINIVENHAYSVNKVLNLTTDSGVIQLLRIRNPWGSKEWNGAWSDQSSEWTSITYCEREQLGLVVNDDGEFWMSYQDFTKYFTDVQLCHLSSDSADPDNKLNMASIKGKWITGMTAGGSKDIESYCCNPQYQFTLTEADEGNTDNQCEIIVGLTQKATVDNELLSISLVIYPKDNTYPQKPLDYNFFGGSCPKTTFKTDREYSDRYTLSPGSYVIIPYAEEPDQEREFLLRIMSENNIQITEYDGELSFDEVEDRVKKIPSVGAELSLNFVNTLASPEGTVDCNQIKEILDFGLRLELGGQQFTEELCQKIISHMSEGAGSDGLSFEEFKSLWARLRVWHAAFSVCGKDSNNTMPRRKLRAALRAAGWHIDLKGLMMLSNKFNLTGDNINFYEFINCVLELSVVFNVSPVITVNGIEKTADVEYDSEENEN